MLYYEISFLANSNVYERDLKFQKILEKNMDPKIWIDDTT